MGKQSFFSKVREWLGGIAFDIFLWSIRMTQDEYLDAVARESQLTPRALDGVVRAPDCEHGYNGLCPVCDAMQTPPRK